MMTYCENVMSRVRMRRSGHVSRWCAVLCVMLAAASCTGVPLDEPKTVSRSISGPVGGLDIGEANLGAGESLFLPLVDGNDALGARLRLIEAAKESIDIKTFLVKPDIAGSLTALALFAAADRGVRVRFLIDDAFTSADDAGLAAFDAHPNMEVRLFNPISRNSVTPIAFALEFNRVNRRMHNKAFIVDGEAVIIGGRNIADEYYQIDQSVEFADFDLFMAGPVVRSFGQAFDTYWNDVWAVPIEHLSPEANDAEVRAALAGFDETSGSEEAEIYRRAIDSTFLKDVREGRIPFYKGRAAAVVDPPLKLRQRQGGADQSTARALMTAMDRARSEVLLITPYFVPEEYGADFFVGLVERGIRVRIITNSLASTNHAYVHAGYKAYRNQLLEAGVELYELRADALQNLGELPADDPLKLTMHTKGAFIDDDLFFVTSMNWDPRSIKLNSELGVLIESRQLVDGLRLNFEEDISDFTFRVGIDDEGRAVWDDVSGDQIVRRYSDPGAGAFSRFVSGLTGLLPVEGQL